MRLFARRPAPLTAGGAASRFRVRARVFCLWLAALAATLAPAAAAEFSPAQRREIEAIVREYLTKNPDVMLDALQAAKDRMESQSRDKSAAALISRRQELYDDPDAPVAGNPQGDVSIVEFFDYRCPYCKQVEPALEKLLRDDRKLRFVYKEFPVLGPESVTAAKAALASRKQGKYAQLHQALMALKGQFSDAIVLQTAGSVGLDLEHLKHDMEAPEIERILKANTELAEALDIRGTPGFVIGSEIVPGAISLEHMKQLIDTARHK